MRCRFKHKIFQNEENGYTIAIFTTQDTSVPLSARDKYLTCVKVRYDKQDNTCTNRETWK